MTEIIFIAAILLLACAILGALYGMMRTAPSKPHGQSYRRHRLWNFK